jgi:hypothetical protein
MKKQSERIGDAAIQLGFELVCAPKEVASCLSASEPAALPLNAPSSVIDLAPALNRRAAETDRALLKAVQTRAAHLSDCLLKRP